MTCRVSAPLAAICRREVASRPPLRRLVRIVRHRVVRWFHEPIATIERERRERDLAPSLWRYDFRPWPALRYLQVERARRRG